MAPSTRVSAKVTETPESQINPEQEVPSQVSDPPFNPATTSTDDLAALQRQLAMAELREKKRAVGLPTQRLWERERPNSAPSNPVPNALGLAHLTLIVLKVAKELAGVSVKDVTDIFTGRASYQAALLVYISLTSSTDTL
ncbi:hypothetical protein E4U24_002818 [Claviceps purpurea]|nr:hypothetical protein E4U24_002818 [Claviceps purpurea]